MIAERYVAREIAGVFVAVLAVLLFVYAASRFVRLLGDAAAGRLPGDVVLQLVFVKLSTGLGVLLPLAFFIAVLLALGRLHRDGEVVAMAAGGIGVGRLASVVLLLGLSAGGLVALLAAVAIPRMAAMEDELITRARGQAQVTGLFPGRFKELGGGGVAYVGDLDPDRRVMHDVFVRVRRPGRDELVSAERARQAVQGPGGERFMVLEDGYRYSGSPGRRDFAITRFERHAVRLDAMARHTGRRALDAIPSSELWRSSEPAHAAELQWRASLPLSTLLLALLALPLSRTSRHQGRYAGLLVAVVSYFLYTNGIGIVRNLLERGLVPVCVGVWPVHLVMLGLAVAMLYRQGGGRFRWPRARRGGGAPESGPGQVAGGCATRRRYASRW